MIDKIKKLIPTLRKINILEKKVILLNKELSLLMPEIIPFNSEMKAEIEDFKKRENLQVNVNYSISKNDLMYRFSCLHHSNLAISLQGYLNTGINAFNIINKVVNSAFENSDEVKKVLDFAAGYGRVTRFLTAFYPNKDVWASEIKPNSLEFLSEQFNCKTIQSSYVPEELPNNEKFDIIYVGSLFSHLPEDLFKRWLTVLYELLSPEGKLIISTHDISLLNKTDKNAFIFVEDSEDQAFTEIDDHIEDASVYGTTYVGIQKAKALLSEVGIQENQYHHYFRALSNTQDIFIIGRKEFALNPEPDFTVFP